MTGLRLLAPIAALSAFAFVLLGLDAWAREASARSRRLSFWVAILGLVVSAAALVVPPANPLLFARQMLVWDGLSYFFAWIVLLTLLVVVWLSVGCKEFEGMRLAPYLGLLLLAGAGLIFLASSNDFLMIFLSIELFGIPAFILAGYLRHQERSSEAAIKFFLIGAFSSAMLAFGISLLYGLTGTTSLSALQSQLAVLQTGGKLTFLALFFVLVSFGFKIALVPFHMWVPDVFEGAPTPIAAFLSVGPKMAGAAIILRVFGLVMPAADVNVLSILALIAALTMTIGNVIGLRQTNVIRLLAYSSIAHMGYLMLGLVGGGALGFNGIYLYAWVYLFMSLGAFAVVIAVSNAAGSSDLSAYDGLAQRSPALAGLLSVFLISLTGIPPTAGFVAKFYVFAAAYQAGWLWLVILAVINSVVSVGYYFKIVRAMYFAPASQAGSIALDIPERLALSLTSFMTLFVGLFPHLFITTVQAVCVGPHAW